MLSQAVVPCRSGGVQGDDFPLQLQLRELTRMPLLGQAAMLLCFDVAADAIAEHDDWHTHEHLPERLSIPGFLRGTRWTALHGQPRYFVMYEVAELATLASEAYLRRLNNPTSWTSGIMPQYRGMCRGFCSVTASLGSGMGHAGLLIRFKPRVSAEDRMRSNLVTQILTPLPSKTGLGSVHLLEAALTPGMTNEQRIRGADAGFDWAILATGYSQGALVELSGTDLAGERLAAHGATDVDAAIYRLDYSLSHAEMNV